MQLKLLFKESFLSLYSSPNVRGKFLVCCSRRHPHLLQPQTHYSFFNKHVYRLFKMSLFLLAQPDIVFYMTFNSLLNLGIFCHLQVLYEIVEIGLLEHPSSTRKRRQMRVQMWEERKEQNSEL